MNALVICDNLEETALLRHVLLTAGLAVASSSALDRGLQDYRRLAVDLVLVAVRVGSAKSQVLQARRETEALFAMVISSTDEDHLCQAYEAGADLVVCRPYTLAFSA